MVNNWSSFNFFFHSTHSNSPIKKGSIITISNSITPLVNIARGQKRSSGPTIHHLLIFYHKEKYSPTSNAKFLDLISKCITKYERNFFFLLQSIQKHGKSTQKIRKATKNTKESIKILHNIFAKFHVSAGYKSFASNTGRKLYNINLNVTN